MLTGYELFWTPIITGIFTLLGVFIGVGATYFIEQRMSHARDQRQREMLGRLLESEVAANLERLRETPPVLGELPRPYQKEVYYEMLPQIGLFRDGLISQIMAFYHLLMRIEYLYEVYKARSTMYSSVIVEAELPETTEEAQKLGDELAVALKDVNGLK